MAKKRLTKRPVALVTGARQGFDIAGLDVRWDPKDRKKGLFEVKARVERLGRSFLPVRCDIAELSAHDRAVDTVLSVFGRVDVLVNNAGIAPEKRRDILETTPASFDRVMDVNARGTFFLTLAF